MKAAMVCENVSVTMQPKTQTNKAYQLLLLVGDHVQYSLDRMAVPLNSEKK